MRHVRHGDPRGVLKAALRQLNAGPTKVLAQSAIIESAPIGPSRRRYANAAVIADSLLSPPAMLDALKSLERGFGRRQGGKRWSARVLDLDIVLWTGGVWGEPELIIPHPAFRERDFVLRPAAEIAGTWRDPISGLTLRQLSFRLGRQGA